MKSWWKSKTLWVNIIVAVLASLEATTGLLQPYLPEHWYVVVAVGLPGASHRHHARSESLRCGTSG
jgi:hypothetical protein